MGFNNPDGPGRERGRTLSDRALTVRARRPADVPAGANGGDSPAWSPKRPAYVPPAVVERRVSATPYAELHCHSAFSFLDGSSAPEELAEEAARLGIAARAITDHAGFYGADRKSVVLAQAVSVRVDIGGARTLQKN